MRVLISILAVVFMLWGCQNGESEETTDATNSENEMENQEAETGGASEEDADDQTADTNETNGNDNNETENDEGNMSDETSSDSDNSSEDDLQFDIHSEEVQDQLLNAENAEENGLTFPQNVITEGMSQTEVEDKYGEYDLIYPGHGRPVVVYGNLGVIYTEAAAFGDHAEGESTDPDENRVQDVIYYADVPYDEVVSAIGEPDTDVHETTGGPVEGVLAMSYEIEASDETTTSGDFQLHEADDGELMVDIMQVNEEPNDSDTASDSQEASHPDEERISAFMDEYIDRLMDYYNHGDEDILNFTEPDSPNFQAVERNQESGDFGNHETYDIEVEDITEDMNEYRVLVEREYSHDSSDGRETTEVIYTLVETPQGFRVIDYEEQMTD